MFENLAKISINIKNKILTRNSTTQLFWILFWITLFLDSAILSKYTQKSYSVIIFFLTGIINILFIGILICNIKYVKEDIKEKNIKSYIKPVTIFIVLYAAIRMFFINYMQRYDGSIYFAWVIRAIENFDFTPNNFIKDFAWFSHNSQGYASYVSIGQFFFLGNNIVLNIQNLLLMILAIKAFYKILCYYFDEKENLYLNTILTACFAFFPIIFSTSLGINTDYPILIFFTLMYCNYLYDKKIYSVFFALLLVFSKISGGLIYGAFIGAICLSSTLKVKFNIKEIIKIIKEKIIYFIPIVVFIIYFFIAKSAVQDRYLNDMFWDKTGAGLDTFGINISLIKHHLYQVFLLNFSWLYTLLIGVYFIKLCIVNKFNIKKLSNINMEILGLFLSMLSYLAFILLFLTFPLQRYLAIFGFIFVLLFAFSINNIFKNKTYKNLIALLVLMCMILGTFTSMDFTFNRFQRTSLGKQGVYNLNSEDYFPFAQICDYHLYNAQHAVLDVLFNKFLEQTNINENTNILFLDVAEREIHFVGYRANATLEHNAYIYIDDTSKKRTFSKEKSFLPTVSYLTSDIDYELPKEAYLIRMPWQRKKNIDNWIKDNYKNVEEYKINVCGYALYYYSCDNL